MEEALHLKGRVSEGGLPHAADSEVVKACLAGSPEAYRELLARYRQPAFSLALQMLGNRDDAEDAAQEAFVRVFQALSGFRGQASFATWFYRIVANVCLGRLRSRRPQLGLGVSAEPASPGSSEHQITEALLARQVLSQLSTDFRTILLLREQGTLSYREIASTLHIPLGTVRSRLCKASAPPFGNCGTYLCRARKANRDVQDLPN